jgi:phenylacetate-CoA ligase
MRFRASAESWTDDARRAWMLQRLRDVVRTAAKDVPYYRELFRSTGFDPAADFSFDDYARLPVLERGDIQRAGRALCSEAVDPSTLRRDATGGSSGTPTELWKGPEERGWGESALDYTVRRVGVQPGSRTALLWGHHLDPTARGSVRERLQDALQNMRWFESLRLSPEVLRGYHRELEAWRPTLLLAYSSALAALAEELDRAGVRPGYPECCFVTGAEKVYAHQRELITRVFGKPLHERYGGRDVGVIGIQLDPARSLSFWVDWSNVLVEPETTPHGGAPASVLITKLHADGMPMLRYRVGDEARFPEGSRPGHPALSLDEVVGREADRISLPSGGWVHGLEFPHMLKDFPVRDYRVHQRADASVTVSVVALDDFSASHRARLLELLRANMPGLPVSVELVDAIPRTRANKWRPVVSDVTGSAATAVTTERAPAGVTGVDA